MNVWDKVAKNFGEVGPRYWNEFGLELIEFSKIKTGTKVLDSGMGRGASLFPAAEKVGVNGEVIGIDSSIEMIN